jgi:hypothetical protein
VPDNLRQLQGGTGTLPKANPLPSGTTLKRLLSPKKMP